MARVKLVGLRFFGFLTCASALNLRDVNFFVRISSLSILPRIGRVYLGCSYLPYSFPLPRVP